VEAASSSDVKTLVVLRFSALGDVALLVPVLLTLTESYPNLRIIICTRPRFGPLFRTIPNVEILPADLQGGHQGIIGLYRLFRLIVATRPYAILDLHNVLRTKALRVINGFNNTPFYVLDKDRAAKRQLTRLRKKEWKPLPHTTERYAKVFEAAGFPIQLSGQHKLRSRAIMAVELANSLQGMTLIGIAPFAAHEAKMYDLDELEKVVAWLNNRENCKILVFGGGTKEQKRIQHWEEQYSNCMNLIALYDFEEELNVISNLDLMISMDSGNGHLSAIFGVPTLTLWGVTHPYTGFSPFGQPESHSLLADRTLYPAIPTSIYGNKYPEVYVNAIKSISVSQIQERIKAILGWD